MSNINNKDATKVIEVRPLHEFKKIDLTEDNKLVEQTSIQLEIEHAKQKLHAVEQQRESLLANLHQEIEEEKVKWEQTKQDEMERVRQEGYDAGFEEGKTDSINQYSHLIDEANELVKAATKQYYEKIEQAEPTIIHLSIQIAEKILNDKLTAEPAQFVSIVKDAIQDLKDNLTYSIYLHPHNYTAVLKQKEELYESVDENATISLYIDEELQENSCLIEHSAGRIDASVDTQLNEIKRVLTQLMEQNE